VDKIHHQYRTLFSNPRQPPSKGFVDIPDHHSASVVASTTGKPLYQLQAGPHIVFEEQVQINKGPLDQYRKALANFVSRL
jgi:hypothetical protein